jgi:hypothetical protein
MKSYTYSRLFDAKTKSASVADIEAMSPEERRAFADEVVNTQGLSAGLGNIFSPYVSNRSGRATALADSVGMRPRFSVKYPATSQWGSVAGGALAGGIPGTFAGGILGHALSGGDPRMAGIGAVAGSGLGASAGGLLAVLLNARSRNRGMNEIKDQFSTADSIEPQALKPSLAKLILSPAGAPHRAHRNRTHQALMRGEAYTPSAGRNTFDAAYIPGSLLASLAGAATGGMPLGLAAQAGHNYAVGLRDYSDRVGNQERLDIAKIHERLRQMPHLNPAV